MMKRIVFLLAVISAACNVSLIAGARQAHPARPGQDRPNILWLVCEDMSPYLSCYGNESAHTPNLDRLASNGIRFTLAYSNGTQCSPSRSTLISGKYAISLGTDIHREKRPVPEAFYFPLYLKKAGYYTSNNAKKDYNDMKTPAAVWDESSNSASYMQRKDKNQPFFSVFNTNITHMARVATRTVAGRSPRTVPPGEISVPGYIPDLPEVRDDIAWNMDAVMLMDQWVGEKLAELERSGEAGNTIVFFFSDHGGTVPRGKAYAYESGTHVPFIAYFPEKWKHLAGIPVPSVSDRLVSFVDFSSTVLNLAGVEIPTFMTGKPFFGPGADEPENRRRHVLSFRSNQGDSFAPARAISDGRYRLIWNYQSVYPNGTRQDYQWQMPAQQAWDEANRKQTLSPLHRKFWLPVETFELYDLKKDSLETRNLAGDRAYRRILKRMQALLKAELRRQQDLGFIPREYRKRLQEEASLHELAEAGKLDVERMISAAETASLRKASGLKTLLAYLGDSDPVVQYWGASGICGLAKTGLIKALPEEANLIMQDERVIPEVKCMLAEAMVYAGREKEGLDYLIARLEEGFGPAAAALQNTGEKAAPVATQLEQMLKEESKGKPLFYIRSILINCGRLPYASLYDAREKSSAE